MTTKQVLVALIQVFRVGHNLQLRGWESVGVVPRSSCVLVVSLPLSKRDYCDRSATCVLVHRRWRSDQEIVRKVSYALDHIVYNKIHAK